MKLNQALKTKSRMVGELNRLQQIFQRENARRNDSTSKVDRTALWDQIIKLSTEIGELKAKIVVANIKVYPKPKSKQYTQNISWVGGFQVWGHLPPLSK